MIFFFPFRWLLIFVFYFKPKTTSKTTISLRYNIIYTNILLYRSWWCDDEKLYYICYIIIIIWYIIIWRRRPLPPPMAGAGGSGREQGSYAESWGRKRARSVVGWRHSRRYIGYTRRARTVVRSRDSPRTTAYWYTGTARKRRRTANRQNRSTPKIETRRTTPPSLLVQY